MRRTLLRRAGPALGFLALIASSCWLVTIAGCDGEPCCPVIAEFRSDYGYVCPKCPDAGARLFYQVNYVTKDGNACNASSPGLMGIKNLTTNTSLQPSFNQVSTGKYQNPGGGQFVTLSQDSTLELTAVGDGACPVAKKQISIKAVQSGTTALVCFEYNAELKMWAGDTNTFGKYVVIAGLKNPAPDNHNATINATHAGVTHTGLAPDRTSAKFNGQDPNGHWIIEAPNAHLPANTPLCVLLTLTCNCP